MRKKLLAMLLIVLMVAGVFTPSMALRLETQEKFEGDVRLIIELEDSPIIEYATRKGVKVNELDEVARAEMQEELLEAQAMVQEEMEDLRVDFDIENEFTNVINGFSVIAEDASEDTLDRIRDIDGVENVYVAHRYERPEPEMISSVETTEAVKTWEIEGYKGEGMVVAIVDTGIDTTHQDMELSRGVKVALEEEDVEDLDLPGKYFTEKVPYGYNYMDKNFETRELFDSEPHGMHVAGTVGANGEIKGVAPECQLLAMKVFSNDPKMASTWGDIYIKAIDDAIALGADVINMSLGSTAGFQKADDPEQRAVARAVENGVLMSISAGNSAYQGYGYGEPLKASTPDMGVVGSPGISVESLQVASVENETMKFTKANVYADGSKEMEIAYNDISAKIPFADTFDGEVEAVYVQTGEPQYYEGIDMTGKIAFVNRTGGFYYAQICEAAEEAGAAAVLVKPNPGHGDLTFISFGDHTPSIPFASLMHTEGQAMVDLAEAGQTLTFEFEGEEKFVPNPSKGKMSSFSSWGVAPNLDFKPEITAPGGQIYSTFNNDTYGMMSGTSMAAPHVSGGAALVLQRVEDEFPEYEGAERVVFAKNLMMSTAKPHISKETYNEAWGLGNYTSPRRQGAGLMDLYAATTTNAIVVDEKTGLSKVALGEMGEQKTFELEIRNFGDEDITYTLDGQINTDMVAWENEKFMEPFQLSYYPDGPDGDEVRLPLDFEEDEITVEANSSETVRVTIDLEEAMTFWGDTLDNTFENGTFIEGFVVLTPDNDNEAELSIPYVGFYGDWEDQPILDGIGDEGYYGITNVYNEDLSETIDTITPDGSGDYEEARLALSFMRNATKYEVNIIDEDGDVVKQLDMGEYYSKDYCDGQVDDAYTASADWYWDGKINGQVIPGDYSFQVRALLDYRGADWQEFELPITVEGKSGVIEEPVEPVEPTEDDEDAPYIEITSIEPWTVFADGHIKLEGIATDDSGIDEITVNDLEPYIRYDEEEERYEFYIDLELEDGAQYIDINAIDNEGNEANFDRLVVVDSEAPVISNVNIESRRLVASDVESVEVSFDVEDNTNEIKVYVGDSMIFRSSVDWTYVNDVEEIEKSFTETVNLEPGENIITITVVDVAGNETEIEAGKVYRRLH